MTAPRPPADLETRSPDLVILDAGEVMHRFYPAAYAPIYFDRSPGGRLNAPDGAYGVLYAAATPAGAFAETFLRQPGRRLISEDFLAAKAYVQLRATRPLRLVKLAGPGLAKLGATAEVTHGGLPYDAPQAWSAALYALAAGIDGVAYTARHDDEAVCYAVFDRAAASVVELDRVTDLDQDWFWGVAERYGVGLSPSP